MTVRRCSLAIPVGLASRFVPRYTCVMLLHRLQDQGLVRPPKWLPDNTPYLVRMGSEAYGASSGSADWDCYGFCLPPKTDVFPHLAGRIHGFGPAPKPFQVWEQHRVIEADRQREYDFAIYGIVRYFDLVTQNNPNMVDSLFVPVRCVLHISDIGSMVRENRRMFLHKRGFEKFRGYASTQMHKIKTKTPGEGKRAELVAKHGYDTKFAYHVVRLALEAEMILVERDLDLERNSQLLLSIRRGDWTLNDLDRWFAEKLAALELIAARSTLPDQADYEAIKALLLGCLEHHYGSLSAAVARPDSGARLAAEMQALLDRYAG